jgi:hypothetical protein
MDKKVILFGCPFDCDEQHESIMEKRSISGELGPSDDPLEAVMQIIRREVPPAQWIEKGSIAVPAWLLPRPPAEDLSKVVAHEFVAFIDQDGCRENANEVERFVQQEVLPEIPCMVAIDHSLTGGVYKAVAQYYGKEKTGLIIWTATRTPSLSRCSPRRYSMILIPIQIHFTTEMILFFMEETTAITHPHLCTTSLKKASWILKISA